MQKFSLLRQYLFNSAKYRFYKRTIQLLCLFLVSFVSLNLLINVFVKLPLNIHHSVDGFLVLGGSVQREIYVAELAARNPQIPILISQGSRDPCILLIFQRQNTSIEKVLLEKCADSTFGNFFFSLPILKKWDVHKVKLITSATHLPRAKWLGEIILGANGIALEIDLANEKGKPGNHESPVKTTLDITRSLLWALASQIINPPCYRLTPLSQVDLSSWREKGYKCEKQANLESVDRMRSKLKGR